MLQNPVVTTSDSACFSCLSQVPVEGPDPLLVSQEILARPNGVTKTRPLVNLLGGEGLNKCVVRFA
jgi:hypothetical protein